MYYDVFLPVVFHCHIHLLEFIILSVIKINYLTENIEIWNSRKPTRDPTEEMHAARNAVKRMCYQITQMCYRLQSHSGVLIHSDV